MNKTLAEYLKIIITAILSVFMTLVVMSGTVIKRKADKAYVDAQDAKIEIRIDRNEADYRRQDAQLKAAYQREINKVNNTLDEVQKDIKTILTKL